MDLTPLVRDSLEAPFDGFFQASVLVRDQQLDTGEAAALLSEWRSSW